MLPTCIVPQAPDCGVFLAPDLVKIVEAGNGVGLGDRCAHRAHPWPSCPSPDDWRAGMCSGSDPPSNWQSQLRHTSRSADWDSHNAALHQQAALCGFGWRRASEP